MQSPKDGKAKVEYAGHTMQDLAACRECALCLEPIFRCQLSILHNKQLFAESLTQLQAGLRLKQWGAHHVFTDGHAATSSTAFDSYQGTLCKPP